MMVSAAAISSERQQVLDFTKPYMDVGLSFMMPQPKPEYDIWSFFKPFALELWMAILGALLVITICVTICSTLSPYDYRLEWLIILLFYHLFY